MMTHPRTGINNDANKDYSRRGDAYRAFWASETLNEVTEKLGFEPTEAQVFAATWYTEANIVSPQEVKHTCGYVDRTTSSPNTSCDPTTNSNCKFMCNTNEFAPFSPRSYRDGRTVGEATIQQLAAYRFYYCGAGGCTDIELASALGFFQPWSNKHISDLVESINAIKNSDPKYSSATNAGYAIVELSNQWLSDGLTQIPENTPFRLKSQSLDETVMDPGFLTFCP